MKYGLSFILIFFLCTSAKSQSIISADSLKGLLLGNQWLGPLDNYRYQDIDTLILYSQSSCLNYRTYLGDKGWIQVKCEGKQIEINEFFSSGDTRMERQYIDESNRFKIKFKSKTNELYMIFQFNGIEEKRMYRVEEISTQACNSTKVTHKLVLYQVTATK